MRIDVGMRLKWSELMESLKMLILLFTFQVSRNSKILFISFHSCARSMLNDCDLQQLSKSIEQIIKNNHFNRLNVCVAFLYFHLVFVIMFAHCLSNVRKAIFNCWNNQVIVLISELKKDYSMQRKKNDGLWSKNHIMWACDMVNRIHKWILIGAARVSSVRSE